VSLNYLRYVTKLPDSQTASSWGPRLPCGDQPIFLSTFGENFCITVRKLTIYTDPVCWRGLLFSDHDVGEGVDPNLLCQYTPDIMIPIFKTIN
jgi:hypothetical protein